MTTYFDRRGVGSRGSQSSSCKRYGRSGVAECCCTTPRSGIRRIRDSSDMHTSPDVQLLNQIPRIRMFHFGTCRWLVGVSNGNPLKSLDDGVGSVP